MSKTTNTNLDLEEPLISTSSKALNDLITPTGAPVRFLSRGITLLYGTNATGKTSISLDLCFNALKNNKNSVKRILYIDHERGVDIWRVRQIMKSKGINEQITRDENGLKVGNRLKFVFISSLNDLINQLRIIQKARPNLLIVDPITAHYIALACQPNSDLATYGKTSKSIIYFSGQIKNYTNSWNMSVLYTSQPVSDVKMSEILHEIEKGGVSAYDQRRFIGGKALGHDPKVRVHLVKAIGNKRTAILEKHRSKSTTSKSKCSFLITNGGVSDVSK